MDRDIVTQTNRERERERLRQTERERERDLDRKADRLDDIQTESLIFQIWQLLQFLDALWD